MTTPAGKLYYQPYWKAYCDAHRLAYDHAAESHHQFIRWIGEQHRAFAPDAPSWMRAMPKYVEDFIRFLGRRQTMTRMHRLLESPQPVCCWAEFHLENSPPKII